MLTETFRILTRWPTLLLQRMLKSAARLQLVSEMLDRKKILLDATRPAVILEIFDKIFQLIRSTTYVARANKGRINFCIDRHPEILCLVTWKCSRHQERRKHVRKTTGWSSDAVKLSSRFVNCTTPIPRVIVYATVSYTIYKYTRWSIKDSLGPPVAISNARALTFCCCFFSFFFYSSRDLRGLSADRLETLPHDRKWVQFKKLDTKFGGPSTQKWGQKNMLFWRDFGRHRTSIANILLIVRFFLHWDASAE